MRRHGSEELCLPLTTDGAFATDLNDFSKFNTQRDFHLSVPNVRPNLNVWNDYIGAFGESDPTTSSVLGTASPSAARASRHRRVHFGIHVSLRIPTLTIGVDVGTRIVRPVPRENHGELFWHLFVGSANLPCASGQGGQIHNSRKGRGVVGFRVETPYPMGSGVGGMSNALAPSATRGPRVVG